MVEEIHDGTTSHAQKCAASHTMEKSPNDHCLDILCHGLWDEPDRGEEKGGNVDWSSAIELISSANTNGKVWKILFDL